MIGNDTDTEPLYSYYCYVTTVFNNHSFLVAEVLPLSPQNKRRLRVLQDQLCEKTRVLTGFLEWRVSDVKGVNGLCLFHSQELQQVKV